MSNSDSSQPQAPRRPAKPRAGWVFGGSLGAFFAALALLAFQVRAGDDPALGAAEPAAQGAPKKVILRRRIIKRVVVHHAAPRTTSSSPAAVAAPAPATTTAPTPAPAPAPAPAPLTTQSS